jgi:hypothetical protein
MKNSTALKMILFAAIAIIGLVLIFGCTPEQKMRRAERKLARLVKKNPGLVKTDTIFKDTIVAVPIIKDSTEFITPLDTAAVDSLTGHFKGKVDSLVLDSLNQGFKGILEHAGDIDTTVKSGKTKFIFKRRGTLTKITIEAEPEPVKIRLPMTVNAVKPIPPLKWHERIFLKIGQTAGAIGFALLLLILIYIAYRILKGFI